MKARIGDIIIKLTAQSQANLHDIEHFMKVWAYARCIGEKEGLSEEGMNVLETAAVLHDIACPLCREKYGSTEGSLQEKEGTWLTENFLEEYALPRDFVEKVVWLVSHHHTYSNVESPEHRILLEADFIVNAGESGYDRAQIKAAEQSFFRTGAGIALLRSIYPGDE